MFTLGRTYILANQADKAVDLNERMIREYPDLPAAHWLLGLSLIAAENPDRARVEIEKAVSAGYSFRSDGERQAAEHLPLAESGTTLQDLSYPP